MLKSYLSCHSWDACLQIQSKKYLLINVLLIIMHLKELHSYDGKEVVDDEKDGAVGEQGGEDVYQGVEHCSESRDGVKDFENPRHPKYEDEVEHLEEND